ncbi:hypothetical protein [Paraburkholderia fungorum]
MDTRWPQSIVDVVDLHGSDFEQDSQSDGEPAVFVNIFNCAKSVGADPC